MSTSLIVERSPSGDVRVAGRINVDNAAAALAQGKALGEGGKAGLIDITALQSADSVTLAVLLAWAAQARRNGGRLAFVHATSRLRAIAHLSDAEALLGLDTPD
ncbi:MAG: STAS domain-containing protein [Xanthomonadales bacterium]|nr:STAS domain-containing protein [Xanthomonadales bacterium]